MAKNDYIRRRNRDRQGFASAGGRVAMQLACDSAVIALHDLFGFGEERCRRFVLEMEMNYNAFHAATEGKKESDVAQEHLDRKLAKVFGENLVPFEERYPDVKPITYEGRKQ